MLLKIGGVVVFGGTATVLGTRAFTASKADRPSRLDAEGDGNALVGLQLFSPVDAGESGQDLVTVTNNASSDLSIAVALVESSYGAVVPASEVIPVGGSHTYMVDLSAETPGGDDTLVFDVDASDAGSFDVDLTRSVGVRNFQRNIEDRTENTNAIYYVSYRTVNVDSFDRFEVTVRNLGPSRDDLPDRTFTGNTSEGVIRIPASGSDGGAAGDEYEFEMTVYDTDGLALQRTVTDIADGQDPPGNDDIGGGPDDPTVDSVTLTDNSDLQSDQVQFVVDYEIGNDSRAQEVIVTFDNTENDWSDETTTDTDLPTGTVQYPAGGGTRGGTSGDEYEITVAVRNTNNVVTDSVSLTDVADGYDPGAGTPTATPTPTPTPDDPVIPTFAITDNSDTQTDQVQYVVDYEIDASQVKRVRVTFDNTENDWSDATVTSTDLPTGTVQYPSGGGTQGGTSGDEYEITIEADKQNGSVVASRSKTDVADGTDP